MRTLLFLILVTFVCFGQELNVNKDGTITKIGGTITCPPKNTGNITAGTGITSAMLSCDMRYNGGSAIDISANPQIVDGTDGQIISITGLSDANTLKLDDGTGLQLCSATSFTIGLGDTIILKYILSIDLWVEQNRSDN